MKKFAMVVLLAVLLCTLGGCKKEAESPIVSAKMIFRPAELSQKETKIMRLLEDNNDAAIFDFVLNEQVQSVEITHHVREDGEWMEITDAVALDLPKGRIAFVGNPENQQFMTSVQTESGQTSVTTTRKQDERFKEMGHGRTSLNHEVKVEYGKEIPVMFDLRTSKDEISFVFSEDLEELKALYQDADYEQLNIVTVKFGTEKLS